MNSSILALSVLVCFVAGVVNCGFIEDVTAVVTKCGAEHNIPADVLPQLRNYAYISTLNASNDVKCFSKCTGDNSAFFNAAKSIDFDFYVKVSAAYNKSETCLRSIYDQCSAITPTVTDCETSWTIYVCLQNYTC